MKGFSTIQMSDEREVRCEFVYLLVGLLWINRRVIIGYCGVYNYFSFELNHLLFHFIRVCVELVLRESAEELIVF